MQEKQMQENKNLKLTPRFGYRKYDCNAKTFTPLLFYGLNIVDYSMNAVGSSISGKRNSVAREKASNLN